MEPVQCSLMMQPNECGCHPTAEIEGEAKSREQASLRGHGSIVRNDRHQHVRHPTAQRFQLRVDVLSLLSLLPHRVPQIEWQAPAHIEGCEGEAIGENQLSKDSNVVGDELRILASGGGSVNSGGV